jgi:putative DNA primase/helicase
MSNMRESMDHPHIGSYTRTTNDAAERRQRPISRPEEIAVGEMDEWPAPSPIGCELPPVQVFCPSMLPEILRDACEDMADRMQVPLDFPAVCAIVGLAGVINRRARVMPKVTDHSWSVVPNLWGGIVAAPGFLKSPVLHAMTEPLREIEAFWRTEFQAELGQYELEKESTDVRFSAWRDTAKAAIKKGRPEPLRPDTSLRVPTLRRLIVGDVTHEKLHELMAENPAGLLLVRDELAGWLSELDRQGREGERAFCLSAWNGDTSHSVDRIGRGSIYVPACCLSLLGCFTPGRLKSYLVDALRDGPSNDGRNSAVFCGGSPRKNIYRWHTQTARISGASSIYSSARMPSAKRPDPDDCAPSRRPVSTQNPGAQSASDHP